MKINNKITVSCPLGGYRQGNLVKRLILDFLVFPHGCGWKTGLPNPRESGGGQNPYNKVFLQKFKK